jgi:hypothetical protein
MIASQHAKTSQPSPITPEFGVSADGFSVARIGDTVLALLTARDGGFFLASAWRNLRPLDELQRNHFYGHDGRVENEAAFRSRVIETAEHMTELSGLSRVQTQMAASTPWGGSQLATIYAEGVVRHSTAGHGGFHLSCDRNALVDPALRADGGWYEEDAEWAIVAATFPELFTAYEHRCADETIRNTWPQFWEKIHGRPLRPGESWSKDRAEFDRIHAEHWVVISATQSSDHAGMTEVIATLGGCREAMSSERRYLIPQEEYAVRGPFGFVIDPERHVAFDRPSSFVGKRAKVA